MAILEIDGAVFDTTVWYGAMVTENAVNLTSSNKAAKLDHSDSGITLGSHKNEEVAAPAVGVTAPAVTIRRE
jgi:hypothetical protein